MSVRDIEALDCELAIYRKGFLSVHIDLNRGVLTWRESNSWFNNFTRTLRPDQVEWLRQRLFASSILQQVHEELDGPMTTGRLLTTEENQPAASAPMAWALCLKTPGGYRRGSGCGSLPDGWSDLCQTIESVSRTPFALY